MSQRLDIALVERGLAPTRARARDAVLRGHVTVDGALAAKAGADGRRRRHHPHGRPGRGVRFARRAEADRALDRFGYSPQDARPSTSALPPAASRRCCWSAGRGRVFAVDVGHGQLDAGLAADPRVVSREGLNARDLAAGDLGETVGAIVADVSFISLKLVLSPAVAFAGPDAWGVFLVKPQFEVGREAIGKGGIVRDAHAGERAAADIAQWLERDLGWRVGGVILSPIEGGDGNREFLVGADRG